MTEPIRILHITEMMQAAGIESFIMNVYRNIDRNKVQFDFLITRNEKEFYDEEINQLGGKKIVIDKMKTKSTLIRVIKESIEMYKIFKNENYNCVHVHSGTPIRILYLVAAKMANVKIRIYHSHSAEVLGPHKLLNIKKIVFKFFKNIIPIFATNYFACSKKAAEWMYPNRIMKKVEIVYNGINLEKFKYQEDIRRNIRKQLDIEENFVVGHIGRFNDQKNHTFLIDIFNDLITKIPEAKLLLIGTGELEDTIRQKVSDLNLEEKVLFLGVRDNVNEIMQGMDIFLLPSNYEGLPVVGIEAQAAGLKCILSDQITNEVAITDNVEFLPIIDTNNWKEKITELRNYKREDVSKKIIDNGYDINSVSNKIENFYINNYNSK